MATLQRGRLFAATLWLLFLTTFTASATDVFFQVGTVFSVPSPYDTNRVFKIQALSPFPGNFFWRTSDVSGVFYVSNAQPTTYSGTMLAPPNSLTFSFSVNATNLGTVNAQQITSIPANGVQTYPAGQTAWSIQASDNRYALSTNGPGGSINASQVTNIVQGAIPATFWSPSASLWISNIISIGSLNTNRYAPGTFLTSTTNSAGLITFNVANLTNGYTSIVTSNSAVFADTNLVFVTSNALASQIGAAGVSAVTATNIATNQVFLGTNAIRIASGLAAYAPTNQFDASGAALTATNGQGVASGLSAMVSTNRFDVVNAALNATNGIGITSGFSAFVSTNRFDTNGAAILAGLNATNSAAGWLASSNANYLALIAVKANTNKPVLFTPRLIGEVTNVGNFNVTGNAVIGILQSDNGQLDSDGGGNLSAVTFQANTAPGFFGEGSQITNLQVYNISTNGSQGNQVITSIGGKSLWTNASSVIAAGITNVYGTNLFTILVANQAAYIPTNFDVKGGSNFLFGLNSATSNGLFGAKVSSTNGFSTGQSATNLDTLGDIGFGVSGTSTNIISRTNFVAFIGAGTSLTTNGALVWNNAQGVYTNWLNGSILTNNGSAWLYQTNNTTLYSLAGTSPIGGYAAVNGDLPAPTAVYTAAINDHMVQLGYWSVSNQNQIIANVITNITTNTANGFIASLNGFGTNTYLTNPIVIWNLDAARNVVANGGVLNFQALSAGVSITNIGSGSGAAILSGATNRLAAAGASVIVGGANNGIFSAANNFDVIGGGQSNSIAGVDGSVIAGGIQNNNRSFYSFVAGGSQNTIEAAAAWSAILGGQYNTNKQQGGVVIAGLSNLVNGLWTYAAGRNVKATNDNSFVYSDGFPLNSLTNSQFIIHVTNGVEINTNLASGTSLLTVFGNADFQSLSINGTPFTGGGNFSTNTDLSGNFFGPVTNANALGVAVTNLGDAANTNFVMSALDGRLFRGSIGSGLSYNATTKTLSASGGGGSQTPIAQDVNWAGFLATNMGSLKVTNTASIGATLSVSSIIVTNGITNQSLTASTVMLSDANKKEGSLANAAGILTNNASGFGYNPNPAFDAKNVTNLLHGPTVSAVSGITVALTQNIDGSTNYALTVAGGSGIVLPPNALGVLTNNGSGATNWSTSFPGTWVGAGTLPNTAPDSSWMPITNAVAYTNGPPTPGQALVVAGAGTNSYGAVLVKGTNWPSGGGSAFPLAADANVNQFSMTNSWSIDWRTNSGGNPYVLKLFTDLNVIPFSLHLQSSGSLQFANFYANGLTIQDNNSGSFYDGKIIVTNATVATIISSNSVTTGTGNFTAGAVLQNLTATTDLEADSGKKVVSLANGLGVKTNNNAGGVGWSTGIPASWIVGATSGGVTFNTTTNVNFGSNTLIHLPVQTFTGSDNDIGYNTAIGDGALRNNIYTNDGTSGHYNTAVGYQAGFNITTGWGNSLFGLEGGANITTGHENSIFANNSGGFHITTGSQNVIIGGGGNGITTHDLNSLCGYGSMPNNNSDANQVFGALDFTSSTGVSYSGGTIYNSFGSALTGTQLWGMGRAVGNNLTGSESFDLYLCSGSSDVLGESGVVRIGDPANHNEMYLAGRVHIADGIASTTNSAVASTSISFPATTVKWTNTFGINIVVYIDNTAVTGTSIVKNGQQIFSGLANDATLMFKPGDYFSETYTIGSPTARWEPQ